MRDARLLVAAILGAAGVTVFASAPVVAQTGEDLGGQSGMRLFASPDVAEQRALFQTLLERVTEDTTRQDIEAILGSRFVPDADFAIRDKTSGRVSYPIVTTTRFHFKFGYGDIESAAPAAKLALHATPVWPRDVADDDSRCLSLPDIKRLGEKSGWTFHPAEVEWYQHVLWATKGHLHLEMTADGGVGEYSTADQAADWQARYAERGCVQNLILYVH